MLSVWLSLAWQIPLWLWQALSVKFLPCSETTQKVFAKPDMLLAIFCLILSSQAREGRKNPHGQGSTALLFPVVMGTMPAGCLYAPFFMAGIFVYNMPAGGKRTPAASHIFYQDF